MAVCRAEEAPRVPAELEEIIGLARALPPEFSADLLLEAANRLGSRHRVKVRALLEDAFVLAERAREPLPRRAIPTAGPAERLLEEAFSKGLDRLSLQARAVRQMYGLDARLGAEYFARLPAPPAGPHSCADRMVWDSSPYWETAAQLKQTRLRGIVSPVEIGPAVKAMMALKLANTPAAAALLDDVARLGGDDRAFTATLRTAPRDLETLAIETARAGGDPAPVLRTLAGYLAHHLTGRRCADTLESSRTAASSFAWYYNDRLRVAGYLSPVELPLLRADEMQPESVVPAAEPAKQKWFDALDSPDLFDTQPLVWWVAAEKRLKSADGEVVAHPVLAAYAKLRAIRQ